MRRPTPFPACARLRSGRACLPNRSGPEDSTRQSVPAPGRTSVVVVPRASLVLLFGFFAGGITRRLVGAATHGFGLRDRLLQQRLQLVIAVETAAQVG